MLMFPITKAAVFAEKSLFNVSAVSGCADKVDIILLA
jgi:hypothetical protein